jgi:hypothetical protein
VVLLSDLRHVADHSGVAVRTAKAVAIATMKANRPPPPPPVLHHAYVQEGEPWPVPDDGYLVHRAGRDEGTGLDVWWMA